MFPGPRGLAPAGSSGRPFWRRLVLARGHGNGVGSVVLETGQETGEKPGKLHEILDLKRLPRCFFGEDDEADDEEYGCVSKPHYYQY